MNNLSKKILSVVGALVLTLTFSISAHAADTIVINNITELRAAIESQAIIAPATESPANGQTWIINAGDYPLDRSSQIVVSGQIGWYFPIIANNLTIQGVGDPIIYGATYSYVPSGSPWAMQDLIAVFGNNVTLKGLTIMPKLYINKTIEVIGTDFTIENVTLKQNTKVPDSIYDGIGITLTDADKAYNRDWSGSIYFNHAGNHTVTDVTVNNGVIVTRGSPAGTNVTFSDVEVNIKSTDPYVNNSWNNPVFNAPTGSSLTGVPKVTYIVDQQTNNLAVALAGARTGNTIRFESDITTSTPTVINKGITIDGNGKTFTGDLSIGVTDAVVKDLTVINPAITTIGAINLSALITNGVGVIPKMRVTSALNTIVLDIPAGTTVTAPGWDGFLQLPTSVDVSTVTAPAGEGETSKVESAFSVGSIVPMSFDKGVRVLFTGEANRKVGFADTAITTVLTKITDVCSADTQVAGDALGNDGNCVIMIANDLVVWTKYFTTFATFTTTPTVVTSVTTTSHVIGGGSFNSSNASPSVPVVTTPTGQVLGEEIFVFTIFQKFGTRNHVDVIELQKYLNKRDYKAGPEDSIFGPMTQKALKAFQKVSGLHPDGIVGPLTRAVLNAR